MTNSLITNEWLNLFRHYRKIFIGYSGGVDSTVLLHHLASEPLLAGKIHAIHIHHGLSVQADKWSQHCSSFCQRLKIPLLISHVEIKTRKNLEEAARTARYQEFLKIISLEDCLVLGHHGDDQAETLLLQLLRGSGIDGIGAMESIAMTQNINILRPFLKHSRKAIETYANFHQLEWIEDESNLNTHLARNFLRQEIIPLLKTRWPNLTTSLNRSAKHCQQAKINLRDLAILDYPELTQLTDRLNLCFLKELPHPRVVNVLRCWFKQNQIRFPSNKIMEQLIGGVIEASEDSNPCLEWGEVVIRRFRNILFLEKKRASSVPTHINWSEFPAPLALGGGAGFICAQKNADGIYIPKQCKLSIRFREGGELFYWRDQTKQLKKLWQEWNIPPWLRSKIPLLYINEELAMVIGFAISDRFYREEGITYAIKQLSSLDSSGF